LSANLDFDGSFDLYKLPIVPLTACLNSYLSLPLLVGLYYEAGFAENKEKKGNKELVSGLWSVFKEAFI